MQIIDYDDIEVWWPWLDEIMHGVAPPGLAQTLREAQPKYLEDATSHVVKAVGREDLITKVGAALMPFHVRVYHGTRVTRADADSIRREGLKPLVLAERRAGLVAILEHHVRWTGVQGRLDDVLQAYGSDEQAGSREDDRIHFCFSREALVRGSNHYLLHGAEVDKHITHDVFGDDSADLLFAEHRKPLLVSWVVPYAEAEAAANPFGPPKDALPSLLHCLLSGWAYSIVDADFSVRRQRDDTAGWFHGAAAIDRIERIEDLLDSDLVAPEGLSDIGPNESATPVNQLIGNPEAAFDAVEAIDGLSEARAD